MTAASPLIHGPQGIASRARVVARGSRKALQRLMEGKIRQPIAGDEKAGPRDLAPHPGRPSTILPGVWVGSELSERKKFITLGSCCRAKFDEKVHHYVADWMMQWSGRCDGCRELRTDMTGFLHQSRMGRTQGTVRDEPK